MPSNELRKDYILDRWAVIATQRKRRPTDFVKAKEEKKPSACPFCPGNEDMTPPATLVYLKLNGKIVKEKDQDSFRHKGWLVRCIPNLYPAFTPSASNVRRKTGKTEHYRSIEAVGYHEVLIESPDHVEHPGVARVSQLRQVLDAYQDRFNAFSSDEHVRYVSIFRNHGADAGASLSHTHTQIMATPIVPPIIRDELRGSGEFFRKEGKCVFCDILKKERRSPRLILENQSFIAFAPWASLHPYEFWIFPKKHQSTILDMGTSEIHGLAATFRACFGGLRRLVEDPSYNFGFHMISGKNFHWHIEVYPRLAIWAGFEKSTGVFINVVSPEEASSSLREAVSKELEELA